jgi:uncharacterized repeat protein (TIGR01451 family)
VAPEVSTMKILTNLKYVLVFTSLFLVGGETVFGAGTPAGTVISSRAFAIYTTASGARTDTVYSAYVTFVVSQLAAVNVLLPSLTRNSGDGLNVNYSLSVLNSGNGTDKFTLTRTSSRGWTTAVFHDINANGLLDAADSLAGPVASTDSLKADSSYKIIVHIAVPNNEALNGLRDSTIVSAVSQFDGSKTAASLLQTNVQAAVIDVSSSLSVDNAAPTNVPITFTLSVTNSGLSTASNVSVTDKLDPRFSYVSSTNGGVHSAPDSVRWTIPGLLSGDSRSLSLIVNVQSNLLSGTIISNAMAVSYDDGTFHRSKNSNIVNVGIGNIYSVTISPDSISSSKEPDDSVRYYLTVKNTGNLKDVIELSATSSQPLNWMFIRDVNNNHILDGGDAPLINTNAHGGVDVDSVAAGDSVHVFGLAILPMVQFDQTQDATTFTATSAASATKFHNSIATTTTNIPVVDVAISVSPLPNLQQPPGAELTYTISYLNKGHADIDTSFAVTARIPDSTRIVLGSVKLGASAVPDSAVVKNGSVIVKTGALKQSTSGTVEFKVKIK